MSAGYAGAPLPKQHRSFFSGMAEAKTPDGMNRRLSGDAGRKGDPRLPPPLVPVDFGYWKLAPAGLGLLGLGVYAGFRKQVSLSIAAVACLVLSCLPNRPKLHAAAKRRAM